MNLIRLLLIYILIAFNVLAAVPGRADEDLEELASLIMHRTPLEDSGMIRRVMERIVRVAERGEALEPETPESLQALLWLEAMWRLQSSELQDEYLLPMGDMLRRLSLVQRWDRPSPVGKVELSVVKNIIPADGHTTVKVSIKIKSVQGEIMPDRDINVYLPLGHGSIGISETVSDRHGETSVAYTSSKKPCRDWLLVKTGERSSVLIIHNAGLRARVIDPHLLADGSSHTVIRAEIYPGGEFAEAAGVRPVKFEIFEGEGRLEATTAEIDTDRIIYTSPEIAAGKTAVTTITARGENGTSDSVDIYLYTFRLRSPGIGSHSINPVYGGTLEIEAVIEQVMSGGAKAYQIPEIDIDAAVTGDLGLLRGDFEPLDVEPDKRGGFRRKAISRTDHTGRVQFEYALMELNPDMVETETVEIRCESLNLDLRIPIFIDQFIHQAYPAEKEEELPPPPQEEIVFRDFNIGALKASFNDKWKLSVKGEEEEAVLDSGQGYGFIIQRVKRLDEYAYLDMREQIQQYIDDGWQENIQGRRTLKSGHELMRNDLSKKGRAMVIVLGADKEYLYKMVFAPPSYLFGVGVLEFDALLARTTISSASADLTPPPPEARKADVLIKETVLCEEIDESNVPVNPLQEVERTIPVLYHWFIVDSIKPVDIAVRWYYEDELYPFHEDTMEFQVGQSMVNYPMKFSVRRRLRKGSYLIEFHGDDRMLHKQSFKVP